MRYLFSGFCWRCTSWMIFVAGSQKEATFKKNEFQWSCGRLGFTIEWPSLHLLMWRVRLGGWLMEVYLHQAHSRWWQLKYLVFLPRKMKPIWRLRRFLQMGWWKKTPTRRYWWMSKWVNDEQIMTLPPRKQAQLSECLSGAKLDPSIVANVTKKCLGLVRWRWVIFPRKGEKKHNLESQVPYF